MVVSTRYVATPIYRLPAFPRRGAAVKAEKMLDATRYEGSPAWSPDGTRLVLGSNRGGSNAIWIWDSTFTQGKPLFKGGALTAGSPAWSPDGQWIAFDARVTNVAGDIWVAPASGGPAEQLTNDPGEDIVPCFDATGENIYFTSSRSGTLQLFRMPARGGLATQVTQKGGFTCQASADGKYIYYQQGRAEDGGLWRLEVSSGKEEPVLPEFRNRNWRLLPDGIYLMDTGASTETSLRGMYIGEAAFFRFSTRRVEKLGFSTPKPMSGGGIDLSHDRKWVYYTQADSMGTDLQIVENLPRPGS